MLHMQSGACGKMIEAIVCSLLIVQCLWLMVHCGCMMVPGRMRDGWKSVTKIFMVQCVLTALVSLTLPLPAISWVLLEQYR